MKAVVIRAFGGPEVLEYIDWPDPVVGPDDVLIDVHAVSVGRTLDVEVRRRGADFRVTLPRILGSDPAGVVAAVGANVDGFVVGDRVVSISSVFCGDCAMCRSGREHACAHHEVVGVHLDGGYAERCALPAGVLAHVPDGITFEQAAAMGVSYTTAWNLLVNRAQIRPGEDVLVMGAGGGLGIAGVAISEALGARPIAAAGAQWKLDRLRREFGVEHVVDYSRPGWSAGIDADVVFENIGDPALFAEALSTLRTYGRLVTCGAHGGGRVEVDLRLLYRKHLSIAGETGATPAHARAMFDLVADGNLKPPPVDHTFPLVEAAAAQEAAAGRDLFGRAILLVR